jgi:intein/homing endonuclease
MSKRLYKVKENYFDNWSHNMAYILGFITADGSVEARGVLSVELAEKDIEVLEFIRNEISPQSPIKITKKKGKRYIRLRINSTQIISSLQQYSIIPNKTYLVKLNFDIPRNYLGDYLRGLFDGDGWVHCRRNTIESGIVSKSED